eukprot:4669903-Prymnesium_polylepis.1
MRHEICRRCTVWFVRQRGARVRRRQRVARPAAVQDAERGDFRPHSVDSRRHCGRRGNGSVVVIGDAEEPVLAAHQEEGRDGGGRFLVACLEPGVATRAVGGRQQRHTCYDQLPSPHLS